MEKEFSHFDSLGNAIMVDVSEKEITNREAEARGRIRMSQECFLAVQNKSLKKGDVLGVATVAGIMAAKKTPELIPLCHVLNLNKAAVEFTLSEDGCLIEASCTIKTTGRTGVEMEALTGVSVALLTIYDMCKAIDKSMEIEGIHLVRKTGGKTSLPPDAADGRKA